MRKTPLHIVAMLISIVASAGIEKQPLEVVAVENNGAAEVKVSGYISGWSRASAIDLERQVNDLINAGYQDAIVYINSKGGNVLEANEIYNVLRNFPGKLTAKGGAIVASAAGYIACKCDEFHVYDNTQLMWHKPRAVFEGTHDEITSQLAMLKNAENDYLKVYSEKTGKSTEDLEKLWNKGDQWLMGNEIVNQKFADKVIKQNAKVSAQDVAILEAIGAPVVPVATASANSNNKNPEMKIDPTTIGLTADATEEQINAKLKELKTLADEATALKKEKEDAEAQAKADKIEALLNNAIKEKRITAEKKDHFKKVLEADLENGTAILEAIAPAAKISGQLDAGVAAEDATRANWTWDDYQTKDPKALAKMEEENPEKFEKLFEAKFKN